MNFARLHTPRCWRVCIWWTYQCVRTRKKNSLQYWFLHAYFRSFAPQFSRLPRSCPRPFPPKQNEMMLCFCVCWTLNVMHIILRAIPIASFRIHWARAWKGKAFGFCVKRANGQKSRLCVYERGKLMQDYSTHIDCLICQFNAWLFRERVMAILSNL